MLYRIRNLWCLLVAEKVGNDTLTTSPWQTEKASCREEMKYSDHQRVRSTCQEKLLQLGKNDCKNVDRANALEKS
jgi:hypothetical protein